MPNGLMSFSTAISRQRGNTLLHHRSNLAMINIRNLPAIAALLIGTLFLTSCTTPPSKDNPPDTIASSRAGLSCRMVKPAYPKALAKAGGHGIAYLYFEVSPTGSIENITVRKSSGSAELDHSATVALRASHCEPYIENGKPIRVSVTQPYNFSLTQYPPGTYSEASKAAIELLRNQPAEQESIGRSYRVAIPLCDVRRTPNQNAPVLKTYPQGTTVTVFQRQHEFARISPDGQPPEWVVFSLLQP
ncbi:energy transducer TonB [Burkholderia sp. Cy-647]|nr:energy transducer TonB [Burkholderia sp. Tr-860]NIF67050.1 energy transducer TonB [Burkholderia sp. Cy-647]NIG00119.1 energy transducer TonB [Burkholderia sp. Ax-1720]